MVAAKDRIRVNLRFAPRHGRPLVADPKALRTPTRWTAWRRAARWLWESDEEGEQAWERLPQWARKQIIDKNIRVFTLPGFAIAKKATDRGDLQLRMAGQRLSRRVLCG